MFSSLTSFAYTYPCFFILPDGRSCIITQFDFFLLLLGTKKAFLYIVLILSNLIMHNVLLKSRKIIHLIITSDVIPYPHHPCLCLFQGLTFPLLPIFPLLPTRWHCPPIIQPKFIWKMHVTCACFPKVFQCFDLFQRTEDLTALMHLGKCTGIKKKKKRDLVGNCSNNDRMAYGVY